VTEKITADDVQQTLQAYLTAATQTGELRGTHVELSLNGVDWADALIVPEGEHPVAARATVHRAGWVIPTVVTELWDEVVPADESWRGLWFARPNVLFGAHALRKALVRTFADVLGNRREPDDDPTGEPAAPAPQRTEPQPDVAPRAWGEEIAHAQSLEELNEIRRAARAERAMTQPLKIAFDIRRAELQPAPVHPIPGVPKPTAPRRERPRRPGRRATTTSVEAAMREALDRKQKESGS
jgi:hypothetical protein